MFFLVLLSGITHLKPFHSSNMAKKKFSVLPSYGKEIIQYSLQSPTYTTKEGHNIFTNKQPYIYIPTFNFWLYWINLRMFLMCGSIGVCIELHFFIRFQCLFSPQNGTFTWLKGSSRQNSWCPLASCRSADPAEKSAQELFKTANASQGVLVKLVMIYFEIVMAMSIN